MALLVSLVIVLRYITSNPAYSPAHIFNVAGLPLESWTAKSRDFTKNHTLHKVEFFHEDDKVHRGADCLCFAIGRDRDKGGRGLTQDGVLGRHVQQQEEAIRRPWGERAAALETA